jgi:hypothetical protein
MDSQLLSTIWQLKSYSILFWFILWGRLPDSAYQSMCFIVVHSPRAILPRQPELPFVRCCHCTNIKSYVSKLSPGSARLGKTRVSKVDPSSARSEWIWYIYTEDFIMGGWFSYYLYIYYYYLLRFFILGSLPFHIIASKQISQTCIKILFYLNI